MQQLFEFDDTRRQKGVCQTCNQRSQVQSSLDVTFYCFPLLAIIAKQV